MKTSVKNLASKAVKNTKAVKGGDGGSLIKLTKHILVQDDDLVYAG